jgi:VanZ family protein
MTEHRSCTCTTPSAARPVPRSRWHVRLSRIAHALLVVAWLGAFTLSHIPADRLRGVEVSDKTLHLVGFGGLTTLLWIVLIFRRRPLWQRIALVLATMPIYGALDELTQPLPPFHRSCDIHDWLFDCLGVIVSLCVLEIGWRLVRRRFAFLSF